MLRRGRVSSPPVALVLAGLALLAVSLTGPAAAQERPGTLSLGIQGQYGFIGGASDFAELFDNGAGFAFRIRYALGGPQAFGISFESQTFGPDPQAAEDTDEDAEKLTLSNATLEFLRYFHRGEGQSQYFVGGLGLYHPSDRRRAGIAPASDGLILLVGGGLEMFILRATSIDVSLRANALLGSDAVSTTVEAAIGLHHYLIR